MKRVYDAGIRTVWFISPVFPGITDFQAIFQRVKNPQLNLVVSCHLSSDNDRSYFRGLEDQAAKLAAENSCPFADNERPKAGLSRVTQSLWLASATRRSRALKIPDGEGGLDGTIEKAGENRCILLPRCR